MEQFNTVVEDVNPYTDPNFLQSKTQFNFFQFVDYFAQRPEEMVTFLHPSVAESMVKILMEANSLITDL